MHYRRQCNTLLRYIYFTSRRCPYKVTTTSSAFNGFPQDESLAMDNATAHAIIITAPAALVIWFAVSSATCVVGAVAGILLVAALSTKPERWEGTNLLILHLLLVEIVNLTFVAFYHNAAIFWPQSGWTLNVDCVAATFFQYMLLCVVHWNTWVLRNLVPRVMVGVGVDLSDMTAACTVD
ncbi:uncharacterized protein LOC129590929 [Paramacrobiotus metropolitanus]|uniref:uncharacterized protein LOC129590929 n=1 Tax=Paramacrobiotus metropolitanus TaxID=2943436 RepID=UPI0024461D18|nr:uncharacterized protein LOC129590929 [Paramacrobiotus metropolitanus]